MKTKPFSKIYIPGLISLVLLPLMCFGYFVIQQKLSKVAGLEIAYADDKFLSMAGFDRKAFESNSTVLEIAGRREENGTSLAKLKALCRDIVSKNDYNKRVTVVMLNEASYQDLIDLIDVCNSYDISFTPYQNKIYFRKLKPVKLPEPARAFCGTSNHIYYNADIPPSQKFDEGIIKRLWPSLIPLGMMVFFSFRKRVALSSSN